MFEGRQTAKSRHFKEGDEFLDYQALINRSDDWLKYAIRLNLLQESKKDLIDLRNKALEDERIQKLLNDINDFHSVIVSSHRKPELPIQKLLFLLDLGFDSEIPEIENAIQCILENADDQGVYQSL